MSAEIVSLRRSVPQPLIPPNFAAVKYISLQMSSTSVLQDYRGYALSRKIEGVLIAQLNDIEKLGTEVKFWGARDYETIDDTLRGATVLTGRWVP